MRCLPLLLVLCGCVVASAHSLAPGAADQPSLQTSRQDAIARATAAAEAMQGWYVKKTGLYATTGWWNAANAITALTDTMRVSGSRQYEGVLKNTLTRAQIVIPKEQQVGRLQNMTGAPGFLNRYYDDEGWWALAWIDAYDLTKQPRYLAMSASIFNNMTTGWDNTCGGGLWWSKDRNYKAAIANELFLSVAAHLALRATGAAEQAAYRGWAAREWQWFAHSGMINSEHLVNDGLAIDHATGVCRNNGRTTWTYNQGVVIGGLAEYAKSAADPALLSTARQIADSATTHLVDAHGVLHETCEPNCGGDGIQFKGIFVRNLQLLNASLHDPAYNRFLARNAEAVWTDDQGPAHMFGVVWSGPFHTSNAGIQASALDALNAGAATAGP